MLVAHFVRRAIGAQEELFLVWRRDRLDQKRPIFLCLQNGHAVQVRLDAAREHVVPVKQQMLRRHGRADVRRSLLNKFCCFGRRAVF